MKEFLRGAIHAIALGAGVAGSNLIHLGQDSTQLVHNPMLAMILSAGLNGLAHWWSEFLTRSKLNP